MAFNLQTFKVRALNLAQKACMKPWHFQHRFIISILISAIVLCSCGRKNGDADKVQFHSSVPEEDRERIRQDLMVLGQSELGTATVSNELRYLGLQDYSGPSMLSWLSDHFKYIVGAGASLSDFSLGRAKTASLFQEKFMPFGLHETNNQPKAVMENLGAGEFLEAKEKSEIRGVDFDGQTLIVNSPRVGIIRIGEALFLKGYTVPEGASVDDVVSRIIRLGTYFHESWHEYGNSIQKNSNGVVDDVVAFKHKKCPTGHRLADEYACDAYANGPYGIQVGILKLLAPICQGCTDVQKRALDLVIADKSSRRLSNDFTTQIKPEILQ